MKLLPNTYYIWTDGSIRGQNSKDPNKETTGCHSYIIHYNDKEKEYSHVQPTSTSNREELLAIIEALSVLKFHDKKVFVYSDSQYCVKGITEWIKGWKRKNWKTSFEEDVKNKDLWIRLDELVQEFSDISFEWVRGHAENDYNNRVDKMCQDALKEYENRTNNLKL